MGRLVLTYVPTPVDPPDPDPTPDPPTDGAEWVLDGTDNTYRGEFTGGDTSIFVEIDGVTTDGSVTTTMTALSAGPAALNAPVIAGPTTPGWALTCKPPVTIGEARRTGIAHQWYRNGSPIPGATAETYTSSGADTGAAITCGVVVTDANGSTAEALSNAINMRSTSWTPTDVRFDGSSRLFLDEALFSKIDERFNSQPIGADSLLMFFAGKPLTGASNTQHIIGHDAQSFLGVTPSFQVRSLTEAEKIDDDTDFPIKGGSVTLDGQTGVQGQQVASLLYARRGTFGNVEVSIASIIQGGAWASTSPFTISGERVWTQGGSVSIGERTGGNRNYFGDLQRAAVWADPINGRDLDLTDPTLLSWFMGSDTTLTAPDVAQAYLGAPQLDFNGSLSDWQNGVHDGVLGNFTLTGTLS